MFKQLLSALFKKKQPEHSGNAQEIAPTSSANELITAYDSYGRQIKVTRSEWRDKLLQPNLEQSWKEPDKLYGLILSALDDGFVHEVIEASSQLLAIDPDQERSHVLRGIVLMESGQLDKAHEVLQAAVAKVGQTGTLLVNLAKIYAKQGDAETAEKTLWRALELDPNQDNGLLWWLSIQREQEGESGYTRALQKAGSIPHSWRPQLWLAREHLGRGDIAEAKALYEAVLRVDHHNDDALMMMSGDLGQHGQAKLAIELIAPIFDPQHDDPRAGFNLLQAYLEIGLYDEGEALLSRLYARGLTPFKAHLDHYAAEFHKHRSKESASTVTQVPEPVQFESLVFKVPVWHTSLHNPTWLFSQKPATTARVTCVSFTKRLSQTQKLEQNAHGEREDELGRLTRAIPLYLAESIHYWTDLSSCTAIPVIKGGGPVVFGADADDAALCDRFAADSAFVLTGQMDDSQKRWQIVFRLWDCAARTCLLEESIETTPEEIGAAVLVFEQRMLTELAATRANPLDAFYRRPEHPTMGAYLVMLGQSLTLSLAANDVIPKESIWGERNILESPLYMALQQPEAEVFKFLFISDLAKAHHYQSSCVPEFKARTLQLVAEARQAGSPAAHLAPLVWHLFEMNDELSAHRAALRPNVSIDYRNWVDRISQGE